MPVLEALLILAASAAPAKGEMLQVKPPPPLDASTPERRLDCTLGRIVNIDLSKAQAPSELQVEGRNPMQLVLPSGARQKTDSYVMTGNGGDWFYKAPLQFERVSDTWPTHVELAAATNGYFSFVILSAIDPAAGTATVSAGRGNNGTAIDPNFYFSGTCTITYGPAGVPQP